MRLLTVEITEDEWDGLKALRASDIESASYTVERYFGLALAIGGRVRSRALSLGEGSSLLPAYGQGNSTAARASHRGGGRTPWRNGRA